MIVSDIWDELVEIVGNCKESVTYNALTRGIEMLASKGLYDPLVAHMEIAVDGSYTIALPRDVKAPLKITINKQPSFPRSRFFEFTMNTEGTVDDAGIGWAWDDRGSSAIFDERPLPGKLSYITTERDTGKTCTVIGRNEGGDTIKEILSGSVTPTQSSNIFFAVTEVVREETIDMAELYCEASVIGRYYGDETQPNYRVIKLSQTGAMARMKYRRNTFKIRGRQDIIYLSSPMAVLLSARAARYYLAGDYENAAVVMKQAEQIINDEQSSSNEFLLDGQDALSATNLNINTRGTVIVADIYDKASSVFGPVGREKLFDHITTTIEALANKSQWDSLLGVVDIWRSDSLDGIFVLPRYVDAILSINLDKTPVPPRNQWYEFHLNGVGERQTTKYSGFAYGSDTPIINPIPIDKTGHPIPSAIIAIPDSALDNGKTVKVFGTDPTGRQVEITVPCQRGVFTPDPNNPLITSINRIAKEPSRFGIRLVTIKDKTPDVLLGYYYPDEVEPSYRTIQLGTKGATRIRILYRKGFNKITSLFDPIPLKSRLAIECMMEAISKRGTELQAAAALELMAVGYLRDEQRALNPGKTMSLQFDTSLMPGVTRNIQ